MQHSRRNKIAKFTHRTHMIFVVRLEAYVHGKNGKRVSLCTKTRHYNESAAAQFSQESHITHAKHNSLCKSSQT